ncbi:hypothetical protein COI69_32500 [Bacillus cereus]|jgi:hypothetical protein|uniref:Uncharacterized protein n=1 Tax=Bacillus cereus TaxID=1396 RepID=A0A9X7HJD2_BACCE|nr:hypothetical protein [Bacillus thuringiensis]PEL98777.1 hypothetical protein CN602_21380 [Bacillus cereus]PFX75101.1 hypothetical protein COL39_07680 [Bacillus cereus]PHA17473.1 hypothetical protein COE70_23855 [Bacillus cereus]PHG72125.1 hypothetical protein COI69_32500 [Bacillus cereus]
MMKDPLNNLIDFMKDFLTLLITLLHPELFTRKMLCKLLICRLDEIVYQFTDILSLVRKSLLKNVDSFRYPNITHITNIKK